MYRREGRSERKRINGMGEVSGSSFFFSLLYKVCCACDSLWHKVKNTPLSFAQIHLSRLLHTDNHGLPGQSSESNLFRLQFACDYLGNLESVYSKKSQYSSVVCN